jgi:DNA-binding NarL/FixJ family response regulator
LRAQYPEKLIAVLSGSDRRDEIVGCLSLGVNGYISKTQTDTEIVNAISDILNGRIYVTPLLARQGAGDEAARANGAPLGRSMVDTDFTNLTPRQKDVLSLVARGRSNKEIARTLGIAEATIKIHAAALLRALGVRNRTEAALVARNWMQAHSLNPGKARTHSGLLGAKRNAAQAKS